MTKIFVERDKVRKGFSYPLKSSFIENLFSENNITIHTYLNYINSEIFFDAHFWLPNDNVPYPRFYIRCGSVLSTKKNESSGYFVNLVLPEFISWAKNISSLPLNSTKLYSDNYFRKDLNL